MGRRRGALPVPRPFLKWAGGKGQLLPELLRALDAADWKGRYHEPFVGGGALFLELSRLGRLNGGQALLSDRNPRLIDAWLAVREDVETVVALLKSHAERHCKEYYYAMRAEKPQDLAALGARIVYLNRTCFNGLFRENSKGEFNVPMGDYSDPVICDESNLRAVAAALADARVEARPFETVLDRARPGDLVYFDPPYDPVSATSSFTAYSRGGFGRSEQRRLAFVFRELSARGVNVILSNSYTDFVRELYQDFQADVVLARRSVNSHAGGRGKVPEVLVRSFARALR